MYWCPTANQNIVLGENSMKLVLSLVAALALGACAQMTGPQPASTETLVTETATIESINQTTREVQLRDLDTGTQFAVTAGPEVANFAQLEAGDTVELDFFEATTLAMADPADTGEELSTLAVGRAPAGERPGGLVVSSTSMVVQGVSYDADSGLATFITPDGVTRRATVPASLRSFAQARRPGQRIALTMTDAMAVSVRPAD